MTPLVRLAGSASIKSAVRALFHPPHDAMSERRGNLVEFLGHVTLFETLGRRDLVRLARIVHEREYRDGEYICEKGRPGAALFILRRGVVEVLRGDSNGEDVIVALLEPPASFEETAAVGAEAVRWFSIRARGPVSLLALGKSDLDALILNFPLLANKVLLRLATIMATRFQTLLDALNLEASEEHQESDR